MVFVVLASISAFLLLDKCSAEELVVRINGGPLVAQLMAEENEHSYIGPVRGFPDTYILIPIENGNEFYHKRNMPTKSIFKDHRVEWAEKQRVKVRQKRDFVLPDDPADWPKQRVKRFEDQVKKISKRPMVSIDKTFNDELWSQQWYLRDTRSRLDLPKLDLNVVPVYKMGITGKGVRISILDDGIEYSHDDLKGNYDPEISWDCNEDDNDPFPRYDPSKTNSHGTRCAGEVAMLANNGKCGVGIAFNAKIGAVKMLDGMVTDRIEGTALGYGQDLVDIYSASWGPNDDGKTVDGPGRLATEAMERGIKQGRGGKGTIYVWASGNGGNNNDNCNCDGYLASPYTVSIGSASQKGEFPWYGEACASTLAVTYSSGAYKDQMIATTDLHNGCTTKHTGTSASAPLAAGIIALALEANSNLTWRDVQHLIVWTSELAPLINNPGWQQNSAGFWFSERFGFGLMNAFGLIDAAINWVNVPERRICETNVESKYLNNTQLAAGYPLRILVSTDGCRGTDREVKYIEHVEVRTSINYTTRGALQIQLLSPSGTTVQLLAPRRLDASNEGFVDWTFMSVMTWGERSEGIWILLVSDVTNDASNYGSICETSLILHGTDRLPFHMRDGPRNYDRNYNRIQNRVKTKYEPDRFDRKNLFDIIMEDNYLYNVDTLNREYTRDAVKSAYI